MMTTWKKTVSVVMATSCLLLLNPALLRAGLRHSTPVDVHVSTHCDQCGRETCVERTPVQDCVRGKKKVYKTKKRCEYVTIAETKYRFHKRLVTKEVPACYCKTVCEDTNGVRCHEKEQWDTTCARCGKLHCKKCRAESEQVPCKSCHCEKGQTTVKVHYWSCVKEPYVVYRRVKREICVAQPRYEHVKVPITRYACNTCDTCNTCSQGNCDGGCCSDHNCAGN